MTMHAIRLHAFGPAENLRYEELPALKPGPGQARIAVTVAGVHRIDTALRAGGRRMALPLPELPTIPGREVAGIVDALGENVDSSWLGRRVVAHLGQGGGGYADQAVAYATSLHAIPDALDDAAAVAMIGTGRTTMRILDGARLVPGDVALVTGATGGIGSLLVQAAIHAGAAVVGGAWGPTKVAEVAKLGATVAVDYSDPAWPDAVRRALGGREVSVAFDGIGGAVGRQALELLGAGGRLILFGAIGDEPTKLSASDLFARSLTVTSAIGPALAKMPPAALRALEERALAAAAEGKLVPRVHPPFPLEHAAEAHRAIESRATMGKTVLAAR
ncbi:zinc-binding dehydrogenase [Pendulispora albinea]|uniref:Zinc-binding dehydrogenase n=1 Tax=Pendulispora albinea TaxID=2741071 RepID=A0ABZ2MAR4_9BACT